MRNSYPGVRHVRAKATTRTLGLELKDTEYGCLWCICFLFITSITGAIRRVLNTRP